MFKSKIFFVVIWSFLSSTIVYGYEPIPTEFLCPTSCDCDTLYYDKVTTCTSNGSSFKINLEKRWKGANIYVNCTTGDQLPYEILPKFNFTNLLLVQYNGCPLPLRKSFSEIGSGVLGLEFKTTGNLSITREYFNELGNLEVLYLESNSTIDLDDAVFTDLPHLENLGIISKEINEKIFEIPTNVTNLIIGGLNSEFNTEVLQKWTQLEMFTLTESKIRHLSKQIFDNVPTIRSIILKTNEITTFDSDAFESLENLKEIEIVGNKIGNMPQRLIINSHRFYRINFVCHKDGSLNTLPDEFLSNIPSLSYVVIKNCSLKSIPENLFQNSTKIRTLILTNNLLTDLPENFLAHQTELSSIDLSDNQFGKSSDNFFKNLLTKPIWDSGRFRNEPRFYFFRNGFDRLTEEQISFLSEFDGYFDFGDNSITDLSGFDGLVKGKKDSFINVEMNPINCDCASVNAYKIYAKISSGYWSIRNTICANPLSLNGTAVIDVNC